VEDIVVLLIAALDFTAAWNRTAATWLHRAY